MSKGRTHYAARRNTAKERIVDRECAKIDPAKIKAAKQAKR
jgi:hypothetical protein